MIGFIQGRLSEVVDGKIQAFPSKNWKNEFPLARKIGFDLIEWTIDDENFYDNPLLKKTDEATIKQLMVKNKIKLKSVTGDFLMQKPFYKCEGIEKRNCQEKLISLIIQSKKFGINYIVMPLVDNGSITCDEYEKELKNFLISINNLLKVNKVMILFESDFSPSRLSKLISFFPSDTFGINYDMGNSASLGFDPFEEFHYYGDRIKNVHIKDRKLNGTTVPLGEGNTNFNIVFKNLKMINYTGSYILQTARAIDGDHFNILKKYFEMTKLWLSSYGS